MKAASVFLPLLLLAGSLHAQAPRHSKVPIGAKIKLEAAAGRAEGTLLARHGDTLLVQPKSRTDTVRFTGASISELRIVESPAIWSYTTPTELNFYFPASVPRAPASGGGDAYDRLLIVGYKSALAGLSTATGKELWTRTDLADLKAVALDIAGSTGIGVVSRQDTMQFFDLRTGAARWNTGGLSFKSVDGWLDSPNADTAILILGSTDKNPATLMAVDLATGHLRWRQDSLFTAAPKTFESSGISYLFGNQPPFADTDTSLILYISTDGPMRLDARTGKVIWRAGALRGAKLPTDNDGYSGIEAQKGFVFVPSGDSVLALRAADGTVAWSRTYNNKTIRIVPTDRGVLVRGNDWMDLVDPATGKSVWSAPAKIKNSTWDVRRGDTIYVAADKKMLTINLPDGAARTLATVDFKENERPTGLTVWKSGIILNSWHNFLILDRKGTVQYQHEYPSPKLSFGENLKSGGLGMDVMRPTTRWSGSQIYFFTGDEDEQGHEGFAVVEVDPTNGKEEGRLWFNERVPAYSLDPVTSLAFHRRDSTLQARAFLDGDDLYYAARNGQTTTVERLLAMGADPTFHGSTGWTALHAAAVRGHADVARMLVAAGAKTDVKTQDGWTPWMLALREGHDTLARTLRPGPADTAVVTLVMGWRLATQGKITEALAALAQAYAADSTLSLWPSAWRVVCWQGSLASQAAAVLTACDRGVEKTPLGDDDYATARLSRAVARALAGNFEGAATDLEANQSAGSNETTERGRWIAELRQGRNPFSPTVLEGMRR